MSSVGVSSADDVRSRQRHTVPIQQYLVTFSYIVGKVAAGLAETRSSPSDDCRIMPDKKGASLLGRQ